MLPYKIGTKVIIDPTIPNHKLHFGRVSSDLYLKIGTIKDDKYVHPIRSNTYGVFFEGEKELVWFKESEIT